MKRLHLHVAVDNLSKAVGFYSNLFATRPCCAGRTFANWRVNDPDLNFGVSIILERKGVLHLGLEVDRPDQLNTIDHILKGPRHAAAALPWEVSVRKPTIRREPSS